MTLTSQETARITEVQAKPESQRSQAEKDELANLINKRNQ